MDILTDENKTFELYYRIKENLRVLRPGHGICILHELYINNLSTCLINALSCFLSHNLRSRSYVSLYETCYDKTFILLIPNFSRFPKNPSVVFNPCLNFSFTSPGLQGETTNQWLRRKVESQYREGDVTFFLSEYLLPRTSHCPLLSDRGTVKVCWNCSSRYTS